MTAPFTLLVALARAGVVGFATLALVLSESIAHAALYEHSWPARIVLVTVLAGLLCSVIGLGGAKDRARRRRRPR